MPVSLSKLCFADDLECIPGIVRLCEVPVEESSSTQTRRKIIVDMDESRVNDEACAALASEPDLYQRGGQLVTVVEHLEEATSEARIRPLTPILLRECLTRCVQFVQRRETKEGDVMERKEHPKTWCFAAVHDRGHWPVPYLRAIVTHPALLADGSLLSKPG